jgi:hypothetical protein
VGDKDITEIGLIKNGENTTNVDRPVKLRRAAVRTSRRREQCDTSIADSGYTNSALAKTHRFNAYATFERGSLNSSFPKIKTSPSASSSSRYDAEAPAPAFGGEAWAELTESDDSHALLSAVRAHHARCTARARPHYTRDVPAAR